MLFLSKIILTGSGSTRCSGRVEIYHNNNWVSVSDYNWDLNDAEVVCRQLNCGTALEAPRSAHFHAETEKIWLDNVNCSGNESSLNECQHSEFGRHKCGYDRSAGSFCSYLIRLAGSGSTRCSGRVEIYHNNIWGRVSDGGWDLNDAEVVCGQLNCGTALEVPHSAHFGAGTGRIWLDNVACSGTESSLTECKHSGFGSHSCGQGQDAGVICSVSDYNWDLNDADVVCRQINCGSAVDALQLAYFGEGTGQIWLSDVTCSGNESSLTECEHSGWGNYYSGHYYDVGVICSGDKMRTLLDILAGSTRCSGRVEIFHNKIWGTVCDNGWDLNDAEVVCRELNCGMALEAPRSAHFGAGTGQIWLDDVACSGKEGSLTECQHGGFGVNTCKHGEDAGVICSGEIHLDLLNSFFIHSLLSLFLFPLLLVFRSEGSPLLLENGFYFSGDPRFVFGKTLHDGYGVIHAQVNVIHNAGHKAVNVLPVVVTEHLPNSGLKTVLNPLGSRDAPAPKNHMTNFRQHSYKM
uniref:SRCR domain-containing protein n=1 Tax=Haplochromis burtoni TaxID=8153 RepID=A0A3Q2VG08_HAPBU